MTSSKDLHDSMQTSSSVHVTKSEETLPASFIKGMAEALIPSDYSYSVDGRNSIKVNYLNGKKVQFYNGAQGTVSIPDTSGEMLLLDTSSIAQVSPMVSPKHLISPKGGGVVSTNPCPTKCLILPPAEAIQLGTVGRQSPVRSKEYSQTTQLSSSIESSGSFHTTTGLSQKTALNSSLHLGDHNSSTTMSSLTSTSVVATTSPLKVNAHENHESDILVTHDKSLEEVDADIANYESMLNFSPPSINILCKLGDAYLTKGNYARAFYVFHRALQVDPQLFRLHSLMGKCLLNLGELYRAYLAFQASVVSVPEDQQTFDLWTDIGWLYEQFFMFKESQMAYERAILKDSHHKKVCEVQFRLGLICRRLEELDDALKWFGAVLSTSKDFAQITLTQADVYFQMGQVLNCKKLVSFMWSACKITSHYLNHRKIIAHVCFSLLRLRILLNVRFN